MKTGTFTQVLMDLAKYDRRLHYLTRFSPTTLARMLASYHIEVDEKGYINADKTRRTNI